MAMNEINEGFRGIADAFGYARSRMDIDEKKKKENELLLQEQEEKAKKQALVDAANAKLDELLKQASGPQAQEDAALAGERAITENTPAGGYGGGAGAPIDQQRQDFSNTTGFGNLTAKKTLAEARPGLSEVTDRLAPYGDQENVQNYIKNRQYEETLGAKNQSGSIRKTDQQQIADLVDEFNSTDDDDTKEKIREKITIIKNFPLSGTGRGLAVERQGALLPGELKKSAGLELIKTGETMKRDEYKSDLNVQEDAAKIQNEKKVAAAMATPDTDAAITLIDDIAGDQNLSTGLNPKRLITAVPGTSGYYSARKVDNLLDKLVLIERGKLKGQGPITDKEQEMLKNATSILSTNLSKEDFDEELAKIRSVVDASRRRFIMTQESGPKRSSGNAGVKIDTPTKPSTTDDDIINRYK